MAIVIRTILVKLFANYHFDVWLVQLSSGILNHEWMRYASYWLQYYWAQKHGVDVVGNVWKQSVLSRRCYFMTYHAAILWQSRASTNEYRNLYDYASTNG